MRHVDLLVALASLLATLASLSVMWTVWSVQRQILADLRYLASALVELRRSVVAPSDPNRCVCSDSPVNVVVEPGLTNEIIGLLHTISGKLSQPINTTSQLVALDVDLPAADEVPVSGTGLNDEAGISRLWSLTIDRGRVDSELFVCVARENGLSVKVSPLTPELFEVRADEGGGDRWILPMNGVRLADLSLWYDTPGASGSRVVTKIVLPARLDAGGTIIKGVAE
jgi:hypothetical protein